MYLLRDYSESYFQLPQGLEIFTTGLDMVIGVCQYVCMTTSRRQLERRLARSGCYLLRHGSSHDIYRQLGIDSMIVVPRHRAVTPPVAASIAKKLGWR